MARSSELPVISSEPCLNCCWAPPSLTSSPMPSVLAIRSSKRAREASKPVVFTFAMLSETIDIAAPVASILVIPIFSVLKRLMLPCCTKLEAQLLCVFVCL